MDPFTPEQQAAIKSVIDAEVKRALDAQAEAFAEQLRQLREALEADVGPGIGAWLRGAAKSWTMWSGALLVALPELMTAAEPLLTETMGPEGWKRVVQVVGIVVVVLRLKTTQSLAAKGAAS